MKRIRPTSESFLSFSPTSLDPFLSFLNLPTSLPLFLPYLYFLTSHSRDPLTFAIYSVLFFFFFHRLLGLFPNETNCLELGDSAGFHLQLPKFHVSLNYDSLTFSQLLLGRSCLRGTSVTCSFSLSLRFLCIISHANFHYNFHLSTPRQKLFSQWYIGQSRFSRFRHTLYHSYPANKSSQIFLDDSLGSIFKRRSKKTRFASIHVFSSHLHGV